MIIVYNTKAIWKNKTYSIHNCFVGNDDLLCQSNSGQKTWNFSWYQEHFVENCEMREFQEIIVFL